MRGYNLSPKPASAAQSQVHYRTERVPPPAGALTGGLNYYRAARVGPPTEGQKEGASFATSCPSLNVKVPTLVIWGEKDTALLTGNLVGLDQYVPQLTIKRIPEGSHWVIH